MFSSVTSQFQGLYVFHYEMKHTDLFFSSMLLPKLKVIIIDVTDISQMIMYIAKWVFYFI